VLIASCDLGKSRELDEVCSESAAANSGVAEIAGMAGLALWRRLDTARTYGWLLDAGLAIALWPGPPDRLRPGRCRQPQQLTDRYRWSRPHSGHQTARVGPGSSNAPRAQNATEDPVHARAPFVAAAAAGPAFAAGFYALATVRRRRSLHPIGLGYQGWL
jgi:hypothetical protein